MSNENVICSKHCGICDGGKEVAQINSNFICDTCGEVYCSNAIKAENLTSCIMCGKGKLIENSTND